MKFTHCEKCGSYSEEYFSEEGLCCRCEIDRLKKELKEAKVNYAQASVFGKKKLNCGIKQKS